MDSFIYYDYYWLVKINSIAEDSFVSNLLVLARNKYIWYPLYVFIAFYLLESHKVKGLLAVFCLLSLVLFSDIANSQLFKPFVHRNRPCNELQVSSQVSMKTYCSSSFSFPSSHAVNHFAIASFLSLLLGKSKLGIRLLLFSWALLVSIGQIHAGAHFPLDILGGALLGIILARIWYRFLYLPFGTILHNDSLLT